MQLSNVVLNIMAKSWKNHDLRLKFERPKPVVPLTPEQWDERSNISKSIWLGMAGGPNQLGIVHKRVSRTEAKARGMLDPW